MSDNTPQVLSIEIVEIYQQIRPPTLDAGEFSGRYLMGRDVVGMPMRHRIEEIVMQGHWDTIYVLDFHGVADISSSVAEELGPILSTWFTQQSRSDQARYVVYANLTEDVRFGLDDEFTRREQAAAELCLDAAGRFKHVRVLGQQLLSPPLRRIVQLCYERGTITSSDLEGESLASAGKKLAELHEKYPGLMCRQKIYGTAGSRSWQYRYVSLAQPGFVLRHPRQDQARRRA